MRNRVLVTGATGVLGKAIVNAAVEAGLPLLQGVRNQAKAKPGVEAVHLDYAEPTTIAPALAGASAMVLMAPPLDATAPAQLGPVIAAAKVANIRHIVLISVLGVNHNEQAPLRVIEHLVMDSGVPFTILRPNFLMENFSEGFLAPNIREHSAIYLAASDGKTSFISARDVAAIVVASLKQARVGQEIDLSGPEAIDHAEVAKIISTVSGRTVTYHRLTEEQMLDGARANGMPEPVVAYLATLYQIVRAGLVASVVGGFEQVTGHKPMTFETFAQVTGVSWQ